MLCSFIIAMVGAFSGFISGSTGSANAIDPGPLSAVHASFTGSAGCSACHLAHDAEGYKWLTASFQSHDQTGQCLNCHEFDGHNRTAHNSMYPHQKSLPQPECASCHTEHKGGNHDISQVRQSTCTNCHETPVDSFNDSHPVFAENFPYQNPGRVNFDHAKHIGTYFAPDSKWLRLRDGDFAQKARTSCTACHAVDTAMREVTPRPFEETCARCHADQIKTRPLVLFVPEEANPISSFVLGLNEADDEEVITARLSQLLQEVEDGGVDALASIVITGRKGVPPAELIEGMNSSLLREAAKAWQTEDAEFEAPEASDIDPGGWHAGEDDEGNQSLRYLARRHKDPVLIAWITLVRAAHLTEDPALKATARDALEFLLSEDEGAGACGKCHRAGLAQFPDQLPTSQEWQLTGTSERPHTTFSHAPHLSLLGPDRSCRTCHLMDTTVDYAAYFEEPNRVENYISNFHPIRKEVCEQCHSPNQVSVTCQTCHKYHRKPGFKKEFQALRPHINTEPTQVTNMSKRG